jgi:hypothetical protein
VAERVLFIGSQFSNLYTAVGDHDVWQLAHPPSGPRQLPPGGGGGGRGGLHAAADGGAMDGGGGA